MAIRTVYERLSAFNDRPGAETVFTDADIVNRTLLNALEEALVHNGVFPVDKALAVDRMAPLRDRRTGVVNATDEVRNEFNPATNRVEDVNRDPVAKSAVDTAEYLGKLRLMFFSIALPMSKPALATVAILHFLAGWEQFIWPMIVTSSQGRLRLLQNVVASATQAVGYGEEAVLWNELFAASLIAVIPLVVLFVIFQRYFIEGLSKGAVKG